LTADRTSWSDNTLQEQIITYASPAFIRALLVLIWQAAGFDAKQKTNAEIIPDL
jgi:hypothetical protein